MNKLITIIIILTLAFSKGDANMADFNIQMGQRNEINTEWDNHYPISKTENIINNYQNSSAYGVLQKLYHNEENVNIVVLGDSTGNDGNEWVYLFAQEMAAKYPAYTVNYYLWNNTNLVYDLVTVVQNGTDSHSLNIWNSSIVSTITYSAIRIKFKDKVVIPNPDLVLISYGHNEGSLSNNAEKSNLRARYHLLTQYVSNSVPNASIMMIAQNPATSSNLQKLRAEIIWGIASKYGYGYINVHDAFLNVVNWETILMNDSVHPNAVGSQVWVGEVMKHFNHTTNLQALTQKDSSLDTPVINLINNGDFANFSDVIPTNWEKLNASTTVSKDLVNFETGTYGVSVKSSAGNQGGIFQYINTKNPNTPINFFKGKWVTLLIRLRKPTGQTSTVGRIALYDGVSTVTSLGSADSDGDFYWDMVTMKVADNATQLRVFIYADTGTTGNMEITIDRVVLCLGVLPKDMY